MFSFPSWTVAGIHDIETNNRVRIRYATIFFNVKKYILCHQICSDLILCRRSIDFQGFANIPDTYGSDERLEGRRYEHRERPPGHFLLSAKIALGAILFGLGILIGAHGFKRGGDTSKVLLFWRLRGNLRDAVCFGLYFGGTTVGAIGFVVALSGLLALTGTYPGG